jgi:hypothetical protein
MLEKKLEIKILLNHFIDVIFFIINFKSCRENNIKYIEEIIELIKEFFKNK